MISQAQENGSNGPLNAYGNIFCWLTTGLTEVFDPVDYEIVCIVADSKVILI